MRILAIGDVFGGVGLRAFLGRLPGLREEHDPDLVVVNAENAASGAGTSVRQAKDLFAAGVDVLTGGNHTFRQREFIPYLDGEPRALRPANLALKAPGRGTVVVPSRTGEPVGVVNLLGAVFLTATVSPFAIVDQLVDEVKREARHVIVDIHAEATSEKVALARHLDGRVTAVVGTHTHVQTADARVFAGGTAFVTDLGMTGPHDSVIGVRTDQVLRRFLTSTPGSFDPADGEVLVQGAVIEAGEDGLATAIRTFSLPALPQSAR